MTPEDYQQAARELARRATMPEEVAARMERELERAFDAGLARPLTDPLAGPLAGSKDPALPGRFVLAAAAALIIAIAGGFWYVQQHAVTPNNVTAGVAVPTTTAAAARLKPRPAENTVTPSVAVTPHVTRRPAQSRRLPPVIQPAGFVPVPAAARLPQFESGVIVRLSLPVTALPSYGVDISPASSGESVEADVLVAQDGVARAIRLVNTSRSQQ